MYKVTIRGDSTEYNSMSFAEAAVVGEGFKFQYRDNAGTRSHYHNATNGETAVIEMVEADEKPRRAGRTFKTK